MTTQKTLPTRPIMRYHGGKWAQGLENAVDLILKWEVKEKFSNGGKGLMLVEGNRIGMDTEFECWFDWSTSRIREANLDISDPSYPASWPWWYDQVAEHTKDG